MFIASEGWCCRYEVLALRDGYLVQMRDVSTGELEEDYSTLFRTLPVAVAYAVMSAAYERFAEMDSEDEEFFELEAEMEMSEQSFLELSSRLCDVGIHQREGGEASEDEDNAEDNIPVLCTYH
ncbi:hypothetical protein WJT86_06595 [Microvirga sp. W0021]|uniref:Uncharacterized protein n=1 Tax=Hohaiivirga grylli TaxID=3133970 RepID=A0ABV0BID9_9HYPH